MLDIVSRKHGKDIYDSFFSDFFPDGYDGKTMKVDVKESDQYYTLDVEVPGANKEDIKILTTEDLLTINVKREEEATDTNEKYIRKERRFGAMSRSFTIRDIDRDHISAKYENGLLHVTLPKMSHDQYNKARTINIE